MSSTVVSPVAESGRARVAFALAEELAAVADSRRCA
jgi:hypothetical protein